MNPETRKLATHAQTIGCQYCYAPPGQPCTNKITNKPIRQFVHPIRRKDADESTPF